MGVVTVSRVSVRGVPYVKADNGAEKSCLPRRRKRGLRRGKRRSRVRHTRRTVKPPALDFKSVPSNIPHYDGKVARKHRMRQRAEKWYLRRGADAGDRVSKGIRKYWIVQRLSTDKENRDRIAAYYTSFARQITKCKLSVFPPTFKEVLADAQRGSKFKPYQAGCGHTDCYESGFRCDVTERDLEYLSRRIAPPRELPPEPTHICTCLPDYGECRGYCGSRAYVQEHLSKQRGLKRFGAFRRKPPPKR